jgi:hypothetical protein
MSFYDVDLFQWPDEQAIRGLLKDNPSLNPSLSDLVAESWPDAVEAAAAETGLPESGFPADCPYSRDQLLDRKFLPGARARKN